MSSDKQSPSAIDYLGHMKEAISVERRLHKGPPRALKDMLQTLVATYNKMCTNKRYRLDAARKGMVYNLLLGFYKI